MKINRICLVPDINQNNFYICSCLGDCVCYDVRDSILNPEYYGERPFRFPFENIAPYPVLLFLEESS